MGELAWHNVRYLRLSLIPMLWLFPALVLLFVQLESHYGYAAFAPGDAAIVKVTLDADRAAEASAGTLPRLEVPAGVRLETPAVWISSIREAGWRISVEGPGDHELRIVAGDQQVTKTLSVSTGITRLSPLRTAPGLWRQLLNPAEPPIPSASGIESIAITYPERSIEILGASLHWLVVLFVLTTLFAFMLRKPLKVVL
jgi:hypothetical protein